MYVGYKPQQDIPENEKNDNWYIRNTMWLFAEYNSISAIAQRDLMRKNWRTYLGEIDQDEINYLIYPDGSADKTLTVQAVFRNYPLSKPLIDAKIGEFLRQKLDYSCHITNRAAILKKEERKSAIIAEKLAKQNLAEISNMTGINIPIEELSIGLPDDVYKLSSMPIRENVEDALLTSLHYLEDRYDFKEIFRKGVESMLVTNSMLYTIMNEGGDPVPVPVFPTDCHILLRTDDDNAENGEGYIIPEFKTLEEILDEYDVNSEQLKRLQEMSKYSSSQLAGMWAANGFYGMGYDVFYRNIGQTKSKILVIKACWQSISGYHYEQSKNKYDDSSVFVKKVSSSKYDSNDENVNGKYKKDKYVDLRECVLVGHDLILRKGRVKDQRRREDWGYRNTKLPIFGIKKNPLHALMTILAPIQLGYSIVFFNIDKLLAQSGGKVLEMWLHNKPDGWTNERWLHYAKQKGLLVKQFHEGDEMMPQMPQMATTIDLSLSGSIGNLINLLMLYDNTAQKLIGSNAASQGVLNGGELVGNIQANLQASGTVSQGLFYDVKRSIESCLNACSDYIKMWWEDGDTKVWLQKNQSYSINITSDMLNADYGIFFKYDSNESNKMAAYVSLAEKALASGGFAYFDYMMEMLDADNSAQMKGIIKKGMNEIRKLETERQKQAQMVAESNAKVLQQKAMNEQSKIESDYKKVVDSATINAQAKIKVKEMDIEHSENLSEVEESQENQRLAFKTMADEHEKRGNDTK
jgi:hypothetical protein